MSTVKKTIALSLVVCMMFISSACGGGGNPAGSNSEEVTYTWKMGTIYNDPASRPDYNSFGLSMKKFVELVNEKSEGRIVIEPYYNSILGASQELFEQLRRGELEVFYGQPMANVDSRFGAWSIPYLFSDYDAVTKAIASPDAPLFKLSQEWVRENNAELIAVGPSVFRGFFNVKHPVATVQDLRDLKVRIYEDPIVNLFWKDICNATSMPYSEVYTGLQTKTIDGLEFADTSVVSSKYYELGNYFTDINWQWTSGGNIIIGKKFWDQLPEDLKEIVRECAWEAMEYQGIEEKKNKESAYSTLRECGVEIYELSDEERQGWIDYARSLDSRIREAIGPETYDAVVEAVKLAK
ncbi:TRAP transporter substrate-binding protein [Geosporobacter ferrireducens]|uniref:TRAP transporter substrate-binding protein n=1 Tax=Geosporobacter ferrireducens TaxID=1424294 RepID=UPI00139C6990|nr:TRAP transporter substrate-binding protein [Geosporobacter ferrireducens]MTI57820.1 TRAP transporter substrate-binding protein [Geosporobacter ferrireducens]